MFPFYFWLTYSKKPYEMVVVSYGGILTMLLSFGGNFPYLSDFFQLRAAL
jgi:hypothetical protein